MKLTNIPLGGMLFSVGLYRYKQQGYFISFNHICPIGAPPKKFYNTTGYVGTLRDKHLIVCLKAPADVSTVHRLRSKINRTLVDWSTYPIDCTDIQWQGPVKGRVYNADRTTLRYYAPYTYGHIRGDALTSPDIKGVAFPITGRGKKLNYYIAVIPDIINNNPQK
jgi:hypothetical protein